MDRTTRSESQSSNTETQDASQSAPSEQRAGLHKLLKTLDFARGQEALMPPQGEGAGARGAPPKVEKSTLLNMLALWPQALAEVDANADDGVDSKSQAPEVQAPEAKGKSEGEGKQDPQAKEAAEAQQATDLLGQTDGDESLEAEDQETTVAEGPAEVEPAEEAPEVETEEAAPVPVPVSAPAKGKKAAKPAAKRAAKPVAKKTAKPVATHAAGPTPLKKAPAPDATPLNGKQCRAAVRWTRKQGFSKVPFIMRRYQVALGIPASGVLDWAFCQAVASFQVSHKLPKNGKLTGATGTRMVWFLRKFYGLDRKGLLTSREVKMAQRRTLVRIKKKTLTWAAVSQLRALLKLPKKGGIDAAFLRKVADFQRHHGLGFSGALTKGTENQIRGELGASYGKKIAAAAEASYGMKTGAGHSPAACENGNLACAWAVNEVLKKAIGRTFGSLSVDSVESALISAGNHRVAANQAKAGDINLIPGHHIGIVTSPGRSLSNSSSARAFVYRSALNFPESYGGTPVVYRVTKI